MQAMYRRTGKPINIELNNIISISSKLSFSNLELLTPTEKYQDMYFEITIIS